jgi:hypothetical protein
MYNEIREHFSCGCFDLSHILRIVFWPETEEDGVKDEATMELSLFASQYRKAIIPPFWSKWFWQCDFYRKRYWVDEFYRFSFWSKLGVVWGYLFNKEPQFGIFDVVFLRAEEKERLLKVLSSFNETINKEEDTDKSFVDIEGTNYVLRMARSDIEGETIYTGFHFKKQKGVKKVIEIIKYLFGSYVDSCDFNIAPKTAQEIKELINKE